MNCLECEDLLQRRLDGDPLRENLPLEQHLARCQSCRHTHAAGLLLLEGLKALPPVPQLPADFAQRMTAGIVRDRQHRRAKMRRRVWITASLAAAILVMVWAGNFWLPPRNDLGHPDVVDKEKAHNLVEAPPAPKTVPVLPKNKDNEVPAPVAEKVDDARNTAVALGARLIDHAKNQARILVPPMEVPDLTVSGRPMDVTLDPTAQSLLQAGQGVTEGLHTVSRNAQRAVSFFMNELPVLDPQN